MMKIKAALYEKLSTKQRIIATVKAEARKDEVESRRLVKL